jgi:predicted butyrate kinase (DUF1464 family)
MTRVLGIDPGTVSIDVCGLEDGRVFVDQSLATADALRNPDRLVALLDAAKPLTLVAGPSGYGLPLINARDVSDDDLRLAVLSPEGAAGGIGGLRSLMRALARQDVNVVLTPGVIHLPSVPAFRKINRVDMGTADKLCAVVLAVHERVARTGAAAADVSFILLELGGAFTAAIAVADGRVVDGVGGTSGSIGMRGAGALDGEVAFLMGSCSKDALFQGGVTTMAGEAALTWPPAGGTPRAGDAWQAFVEGAVKTVLALTVSAPKAREVVLSGRMATPDVRDAVASRLKQTGASLQVETLAGLGTKAKHAAQGAALLADGLSGGSAAAIVDRLGIREASGTVLDHLVVISPADARRRLGMSTCPPAF